MHPTIAAEYVRLHHAELLRDAELHRRAAAARRRCSRQLRRRRKEGELCLP